MSEVTKLLTEHYETCLSREGATARGMDWENEERLNTRFSTIVRAMRPLPHSVSLLDVASGAGLLVDYLRKASLSSKIVYTGIDASAKMIAAAGRRHPDARFLVGDITSFDWGEQRFDYVVANGLFTLRASATEAQMHDFFHKALHAMFRICRTTMVFNVMSKHVDFEVPHLYYRFPEEVLRYCITRFSRRVAVYHDYPLHEFFTAVTRA